MGLNRDLYRVKRVLQEIINGDTAEDSIAAVARALAEVRAETWREAMDAAERECDAINAAGARMTALHFAALRAKAEEGR